MESPQIYYVVAAAFFGFVALAFILLFPIWRFIRREEQRSEEWTPRAIAERRRQSPPPGDGAPTPPPQDPEVGAR